MAEVGRFATLYATNGMVCSPDHLASSAGVAILRAGGSAADAAIATSAVLAVTTPFQCGMGGDLFALAHVARGAPVVLNASGRAGSGADPDRLRADRHDRMPLRGDIRSVPVPGCVDGWLTLHERLGRLPLGDVLAPAIACAQDGFAASALLAAMVPLVQGIAGTEPFFQGGRLRAGHRVHRPGVAVALQAIARSGRDGFYGGAFGEGLLQLGREAPGGTPTGEYAPDDLATSLADWVEPLGRRLWDHDVWTVPPNSQGYLTLGAASVLERLDRIVRLPPPAEAGWAHLLAEASKLAGADRPDVLHEHADGDALLAADRLDRWRSAIDPGRAVRLRAPHDTGGTIFLCVVDGDGHGVSLIQSNAADFGAYLVEPTTGIFLHNRGIGFSLTPGHPAEYGPGRRPPSTLAPALVTRPDGTLRTVLGTMGGDVQPQTILQLLVRLLHAGEPPGTVVSAPRWLLRRAGGRGFDLWDADTVALAVEADAPAAWFDGLAARGHEVVRIGSADHAAGHAQLIDITPSGTLAGASDPRAGSGAAAAH